MLSIWIRMNDICLFKFDLGVWKEKYLTLIWVCFLRVCFKVEGGAVKLPLNLNIDINVWISMQFYKIHTLLPRPSSVCWCQHYEKIDSF